MNGTVFSSRSSVMILTQTHRSTHVRTDSTWGERHTGIQTVHTNNVNTSHLIHDTCLWLSYLVAEGMVLELHLDERARSSSHVCVNQNWYFKPKHQRFQTLICFVGPKPNQTISTELMIAFWKCLSASQWKTGNHMLQRFYHLTKIYSPYAHIYHTNMSYNTSINSQFMLSSFLKACASDDGKAVGWPRPTPLVFCFFWQGSSKVKSSSTSSFFALSPVSDEPSPAHLSAWQASDTINDTLYKNKMRKEKQKEITLKY